MCDRNHLNLCVSTHDAESFGIDTVHRSTFIVDGGLFKTQNTYDAFFTSGWTSTNASDTPFSTGIPFGTISAYGSEIPFSEGILCLPVDYGSAYAPGTPFCTGVPVDAGFAYGAGIPFSTELPFAPGSCHLQITDQSTCSQHTDCGMVYMSCNGSISVCTSKSPSCTVWKTVRCDDESVPPFSLAVGHDSLSHTEEIYNSESSSDRSQVEDQLTCNQFAASTNGSQTRNRTHGDASDVGGVPETSESHGDDFEDEVGDASDSKSEYEENILVYDTGVETPCVGQWIIIVCILLRWYCRPTNLEKRPRYLRTRIELENLGAKPEVHCVSRSLRRCVALATIHKRFRAWRIDTKNEKYDRINYVVGVAFLLIVMFQPVAEGSAVVAVTSSSTNVTQHRNETALVNETNFHTDMNQLAALTVDSGLKEFIGSLAVELREMKSRLDVVESTNVDLQKENAEMNDTIMELRNENTDLKRRTASLEGANVEIREENANMKDEMVEIRNANVKITNENVKMRNEIKDLKMKAAETESGVLMTVGEMSSRLDRCEAETSPFLSAMEHRRMQDEETLCRGSGMLAMFASCCPSSSDRGGHRRSAQSAEGCDSLPPTCSTSCAPLFIDYVEGCQSIVDSLASDQRQMFMDFY
eukprot:SAG31_NODE_2660_length_5284_cov_14.800000_1_plen_641_part_10